MTDDADAIKVYWRPGCGPCSSRRVALAEAGVVAEWHDIWAEAEALAFVRQVADGNETVPTLLIGGAAHVAPSPRRAVDLIAEAAPHLVAHRGRWSPLRIVQWLSISVLLIGGQALAVAGHRSWSNAATAAAVVAYWSLRRLRARRTGAPPGTGATPLRGR